MKFVSNGRVSAELICGYATDDELVTFVRDGIKVVRKCGEDESDVAIADSVACLSDGGIVAITSSGYAVLP